MNWLRRWWNRRRREMDRMILVPTFVREAPTLDDALLVMFVHISLDPAWADLEEREAHQLARSWIEEAWAFR